VEQIGKAKRTVFVQAYSFSSQKIANALIDAKNDPARRVDVQVIMDKEQAGEAYSRAPLLSSGGIPVFLDAAHQPNKGIQHNKVLIIDESVVVTGSFNFSEAAESKNAENLLIVSDPTLAAKYRWDWDKHRSHSDAFGTATTTKPIGPMAPEEAVKYMGKDQPCIVDLLVAYVGTHNGRVFLNKKFA
jgi:phosphatidylserine/phosphatidylglycerophosphate/cardiolipin synthase-like enzyme